MTQLRGQLTELESHHNPMKKLEYGSVGPQRPPSLPGLPHPKENKPVRLGNDDANIPNFLDKRASSILKGDTRGVKGSIFAQGFIDQVAEATGESKARQLARGVLPQIAAFLMMVAFSGLTPLLKQGIMVTDPVTKKRGAPFLAPTLYLVDYSLSLLLGNILSLLIYGHEGLKECWSVTKILQFAPACICASVSETMQIFVLMYLDGTSWRILKQLKLPFTALGVYFILGRRKQTSATQWVLIGAVCTAVIGYCVSSSKGYGEFSGLGVTIAMISVIITTGGGLIGDYTYKTVKGPLVQQITVGRVTSIICTFIITIVVAQKDDQWSRFLLGGWTWRVLAMSCWLVMKDWTASFVLKHLDSLWKAIGGVLSLCVTYILDLIFMGKAFSPIAFCFILSVMIDIFAFTLSRRDQAAKTKDNS